MTTTRPDRAECIIGQGQVVLGGGLEGIRIDEEAAGVVRDLCLGIIEEFMANWSLVAPAVWAVVHDIGVEIRTQHQGPGEVTAEELIAGVWKVVGERQSAICLRLKTRLNTLGFTPPPASA